MAEGMRLQTMRVRSSVRWSKNDILPCSSVPAASGLALASGSLITSPG